MNEIDAQQVDGQWRASDGTVLCRAAPGAPARARRGVRAEHVAPEGGATPAELELVEDAGHQKILVARFAGTRLHLAAPRASAWKPGDVVHPRLDAARVVVWA